jgi:DNA-binding HxlR family transcriptional regulator
MSELNNTFVTNADSKGFEFRKKIEDFYSVSKSCRGKGYCPVHDILAPSVDKWSLFIIYNLAYSGELRFNTLKKYIDGISSRMLSVNLKKLEKAGILSRKVFAEVPPRVEYKLTEFGMSYAEKLIDLNLWLVRENPLL